MQTTFEFGLMFCADLCAACLVFDKIPNNVSAGNIVCSCLKIYLSLALDLFLICSFRQNAQSTKLQLVVLLGCVLVFTNCFFLVLELVFCSYLEGCNFLMLTSYLFLTVCQINDLAEC